MVNLYFWRDLFEIISCFLDFCGTLVHEDDVPIAVITQNILNKLYGSYARSESKILCRFLQTGCLYRKAAYVFPEAFLSF